MTQHDWQLRMEAKFNFLTASTPTARDDDAKWLQLEIQGSN